MTIKTHHWVVSATVIGIVTAAVFAYGKTNGLVRTGAGYKAKVACSEVFLAGRNADDVLSGEFDDIDPLLDRIPVKIDPEKREAFASGPLGLGQAKAIFRDGYGCTLVNGGGVTSLPSLDPLVASAPWPEAPPVSGKALPHVDYAALDFALTNAFEKNRLNHRAVLVAVDGKIIAERYAEGFSKETSFLSWSAAKSVTATLVGAAVLEGLIDINDPAPVPEWQGDDERAAITWSNLLHMQSGLAFSEDYANPNSDVNRMLFHEPGAGAVAADQPLIHPPGTFWDYSSGTSNIIARALRQVLDDTGKDYYTFAQLAIYGPIGATSITMEPDASGANIGSSFIYATARDWARLGQLYLEDGVWNGAQLLPEGWINYVTAPAAATDNHYGAHFWLNRDGKDGRVRFVPGLPEGMYFMSGHEGQFVYIIPDKRMVIVRTGITRGEAPREAIVPLLEEIYTAVGATDETQTE